MLCIHAIVRQVLRRRKKGGPGSVFLTAGPAPSVFYELIGNVISGDSSTDGGFNHSRLC
jgi:hypothetical protein